MQLSIKSPKQQRKELHYERSQRSEKVFQAAADERRRFNEALKQGKKAFIKEGKVEIDGVTDEWWYTVDGIPRYAGANDPLWRELLQQVGLKRDPLFAEHVSQPLGLSQVGGKTSDFKVDLSKLAKLK